MTAMAIRSAVGIPALISLCVCAAFAQTRRQIKPPAAKPLTPQQIAQLAMPSVVFVVTFDAKGQPLGRASAFFVRPHVLITNLHVVRGASQIRVSAITENSPNTPAVLYFGDAQQDLALLQVDGMAGIPLKLTVSTHNIGDRVFVVGNPKGLEGTFSEGIISGFREDDRVHFIQITAPISHGSSGGPVLDDRGQVIGVASAAIEGGQNLNFAIDLDDISLYLLEEAAKKSPAQTASANQSAKSGPPPRPEPTFVDERGSLTGIPSVRVLVEPLQYEIFGVTESQIKVDAELRLRKAGIQVADKAFNVLYINLNLLDDPGLPGTFAYHIDVRFQQVAETYGRDDNLMFFATTWSKGAIGLLGSRRVDQLRSRIEDEVDKFINDYLAANPKR